MTGAVASPEGAAIARLVHDFCWDWLPNQHTSSENTLRSYRTSMTLYLTWLAGTGVTPSDLRASSFSASSLEAWLVWLAGTRGNSPQTCNNRLAAVKTFCGYASDHDPTFASLAVEAGKVEQRTAVRTKVRGMSEAAVGALTSTPDQATRQGRRDAAIMVTLYSTAARVGELLSMRVSQLRLDGADAHAVVIGKGGKGRALYLPELTVGHLRAYLREYHGTDPDPQAYLFWSRNHEAGTHPLSRDAVADLIDRHAKEARKACAEVPERVTPHTFRHARASHWLQRGMNIAQISLLLGHSSIKTTMEYLDVTIEALGEAMQSVAGAPEAKKWKGAETTLLSFCGMAEG